MPPRKEKEVFAELGEKDHWHPYGLQGLNPDRFGNIVTNILQGKFNLLKLRLKSELRPDHIT